MHDTCSLKALVCAMSARLADQPLQPTDADESTVGRHDTAVAVGTAALAADAALSGTTQRRHARSVGRRRCTHTKDRPSSIHTHCAPPLIERGICLMPGEIRLSYHGRRQYMYLRRSTGLPTSLGSLSDWTSITVYSTRHRKQRIARVHLRQLMLVMSSLL